MEITFDKGRAKLNLFGITLGKELLNSENFYTLPIGLESFNFIRDIGKETLLQVKMRMKFLEELNGTGESPALKIEHDKSRTYVTLFGVLISDAIERVKFNAGEKECPTINLTLRFKELEKLLEEEDLLFKWFKEAEKDAFI